MSEPTRPKTPGSGRKKGTPNRRTSEVQDFFAGVLEAAHKEPRYKQNLVVAIVTLQLDPKVWAAIYHYVAGQPTRQVTLNAGPSLAQLISGRIPKDDDDE